jgi:ABC-2 type transport system permease protein
MNNKLLVIARKDISEAFRSRSTYIVILVMILLSFVYISNYNNYVKGLGNKQLIIDYSRSFLNSLAYVLPAMFSTYVCSIFANYAVVVDKAKRNLESLMASPVSIKQIWLGKSLAVTLPSLGVGLAIAIISFLVMDIGFVAPKAGGLVIPDPLAFVSTFILVPILVFGIVTIVTYIQLVVTNPRIGNFVFSGIFILLFFGINALGGFGVSIRYFSLVYLGLIILCAVVSYILSLSLTKEKVLLSSKV